MFKNYLIILLYSLLTTSIAYSQEGILDKILNEEKEKKSQQQSQNNKNTNNLTTQPNQQNITTVTNNTKNNKTPTKEQKKVGINNNNMQTNNAKMQSSILVSKLLKLDYNFYIMPEEYYAKPFSIRNSHLPPVYFNSYYAKLAFEAIENENLDVVRYFVDRFAKEHKLVVDKYNNNLLIHAVYLSKYDVVRLLVMKKKFNINHQNDSGLTALHVAAIKGDYEMVKILLTMGADYTLLDNNNLTAIDYAIQTNNKPTMSIIRDHFYNKFPDEMYPNLDIINQLIISINNKTYK